MAKIGDGNAHTLSVRDIQTGRVTAIVTPPDRRQWTAVSATADPHVFYATATTGYGSPTDRLSVYRVTIDAAGRVRTRTERPGRSQNGLSAFAAAPDGTRLAFSVANRNKGPATLEVLTVSNGRAYGLPGVGGRVRVGPVLSGRRAAPGLSARDAAGRGLQRPDPRHQGGP
jgi:hypothetical protein